MIHNMTDERDGKALYGDGSYGYGDLEGDGGANEEADGDGYGYGCGEYDNYNDGNGNDKSTMVEKDPLALITLASEFELTLFTRCMEVVR